MTEAFRPAPLPDHSDYDEAAKRVQSRLLVPPYYRAKDMLIKHATSTPSLVAFASTIEGLAIAMEQVDRSTQELLDAKRLQARAVWLGALAGLMVAQEAHGTLLLPSRVLEYAPRLNAVIDTDDSAHARHVIAERVITLGEQGLEIVGESAEERLDSIGGTVVRSIDHQRMFRISSGLVVTAAHEMHKARIATYEQEEMEALAAVAADVDWDAALRGLQKKASDE